VVRTEGLEPSREISQGILSLLTYVEIATVLTRMLHPCRSCRNYSRLQPLHRLPVIVMIGE
jgi:hypothetical protein